MKVLVLIVVVSFLAFAVGYNLGAKDGVYQASLMNGSAKASILAGELGVLRAGKGEKLIPGKEIELDGEIVLYSLFKSQGRPWIFWPYNPELDHERSIAHALSYRQKHPSPYTNEYVSQIKDLESKKGAEETREIVKQEVQAYGK